MDEKITDKIRKIREVTTAIRNTYEATGTISAEDLDFLLDRTERHTIISEIADSDWSRWRVDVFTKNMEIEELKRQLKEANGN